MDPLRPDGRFLIGDRFLERDTRDAIRAPWSGETLAEVSRATAADVEQAIDTAAAAFPGWRATPAWRRARVLARAAARLERDAEGLARLLGAECAKPIRDARAEVARAQSTFRIAAEEATRLGGETLPLDLTPAGEGKLGITRRFPLGVVAAITPFNFPLNLVAHKVAPALAAGNSVVLKPAPRTPLSALALARILLEEGLPPGVLDLVTPAHADAAPLIEDPRVAMLSFTGSAEVGWALRARAGRKRVTLELGGDAAVVLEPDADLERALPRVARGAYVYAGQVCIGVQRIFVHERIAKEVRERLEAATRALVLGDPADEASDLSALIDEAAAQRVDEWIDEALEGGASALVRGVRRGNRLPPALLWDAPAEVRLSREEAFGPVAVLYPYRDFAEAIARVNASRYGLQAGVFTRDLGRALLAWEQIEAGAVLVNEVPTFRVDSMPYGGVKESGIGREGVRYAIESMTDERLLVVDRG